LQLILKLVQGRFGDVSDIPAEVDDSGADRNCEVEAGLRRQKRAPGSVGMERKEGDGRSFERKCIDQRGTIRKR
jgi:hypothetical protein